MIALRQNSQTGNQATVRRILNSRKISRIKAKGSRFRTRLREIYYGLTERQILSVDDALPDFPAEYVFRTPMPDVPFANVVDIDSLDNCEDLSSPTYEAYLARLKRATIFGGSDFILNSAYQAVNDVAADPDYGRATYYRSDQWLKGRDGDMGKFVRFPPTREIRQAFHLSGYLSSHFGHWVCEYLPRLRHLEKLPGWKEVPILVNDDMPASHYEALSLVVDNPLIRVAREETLLVETLYVAPTINFMPPELLPDYTVPIERHAVWSAEAMQYLRARILRQVEAPAEPVGKIFFSRRNSVWARPLNEQLVEDTFADHGFQTFLPERLSFTEQVQAMQSADFIAGPSGSAFNLAMFARPGVPILMLAQGQPHNWGGWLGPMRQLGFDVRFLLSETASATEKLMSYEVDAQRIPDIIERMQEDAEALVVN